MARPFGCVLLATALLHPNAATVIEQWGQWEQTWTGPTSGNPFTDVDLIVELTPPTAAASIKTLPVTVRGFYDGEGNFKVRFMPPVVGTWKFETRSNVAVLDGRRGHFLAVTPSSKTMFSNHGPVITKANSTTFSYADGSPFHAVGTTIYGMFGAWGSESRGPNKTAITLQSLRNSPFNKVRIMAFPTGNPASPPEVLPYVPIDGKAGGASDLTRFNVKFWHHVEMVVKSLMDIGIEADIILFNLYDGGYPAGLRCMGGPNASTYNMTNDTLYLRYIVARLASFRNVWWSMSNEWNQCPCKWAGALRPSPCPNQRDFSDPGCGIGNSNSPAWDTPIWDELFKTVHREDPSHHLMSIHNNGYLYNYSRPWISHFSVQHTHNKPKDLWMIYGRKPFVWDEVKYEGNNAANWGSLSAPQMVQRFWWGAAVGAYGGHGEVLNIVGSKHCGTAPQDGGNSWSGGGGYLCGQSPERIAWFRSYIENTTLHPPFEECEGDDDGYVRTLTCGTDYIMFNFYNGHPNASHAFQYVYLPAKMKNRQDLLQPWEMRISLIYKPPSTCRDGQQCSGALPAGPPPPGSHIWGPSRGPGWQPVGINVDEDTLPHILTFTSCKYRDACSRDDGTFDSDRQEDNVEDGSRYLALPWSRSEAGVTYV